MGTNQDELSWASGTVAEALETLGGVEGVRALLAADGENGPVGAAGGMDLVTEALASIAEAATVGQGRPLAREAIDAAGGQLLVAEAVTVIGGRATVAEALEPIGGIEAVREAVEIASSALGT